jgi:hypothetical protein
MTVVVLPTVPEVSCGLVFSFLLWRGLRFFMLADCWFAVRFQISITLL